MPKDYSRRPNRVPWPPLIMVAAIAAAVYLGHVFPTPWLPFSGLVAILFMFGMFLIGGGIALAIYSLYTLSKADTTMLPHRGADKIVMHGPYALSRHPIYLADIILLVGAGFISHNAWFFLMAYIAGFLIQKLAIEPEEQHLIQKFGRHYRDYTRRVNRWI